MKLKLPVTMATMMYPSLTKSQSMRTKRKSAVELLAESKPFYVKSETVRDTKQVLPLRSNSAATAYGTYNRSKSVNVSAHYRPTTLSNYMAVSPSRSLPPLTHRRTVYSTTSTDLLQNRLRQLLVCDSAEELRVDQMAPLSPPAEYAQRCHKSLPDLHCREPSSNKSSNKSLSNRDSGGSSGHYTQRSEPPPSPRPEVRRDSGSSTQHSGGSSYYCCQEPECRAARQAYAQPQLSPGPQPSAVFKRQKCLRYKRDRPILRSKSDISDRYRRPNEPPHHQEFFEYLGLSGDRFEEMLNRSDSTDSPVFFSEVSSVDSSRPIENVDYCPSAYRSGDPPSIVERNARIIKWLCNCRKVQWS
ncbi:unnamed protein product [Phyllotreta striolata]|uniref:Centrosome-associated FAM110 C-terminal domain-containing protein n=1 Tax=Phyllotreta striolata TaxID=444603 RepID=A0A9N9XSV0_PHYSR|nr:unnamed protein product [Phyllotreta striolata]